jgi:hypothetical protein
MTTRDIAKIERISIRNISDILQEEEIKQQEIENDKRQKHVYNSCESDERALISPGMDPASE